MVRVRFKHWCLGVRGVSLRCVLSAEPRPRVRKKGPTASPVPQDGKNTPPPFHRLRPSFPVAFGSLTPGQASKQPHSGPLLPASDAFIAADTPTPSRRGLRCPPPGRSPPPQPCGGERAAAAAARPRGPLRAPSSGRGRAGTPQSRHRCPHCALQHL